MFDDLVAVLNRVAKGPIFLANTTPGEKDAINFLIENALVRYTNIEAPVEMLSVVPVR